MIIHTVKNGDSLWKLSQNYGVPLSHILVANGLSEQSILVIGQAVIVPTEPSPATHKVLAGESLWQIGQRYGVTLQELASANGIRNPALIYPGQMLKIPATAKPVIEVNAYTEKLEQNGVAIVNEIGEYLTFLSPFSYRVQPDGSLRPLDDTAVIAAAYAKRAAPMMVITNFVDGNFSPDIAHAVVAEQEVQNRVIANIAGVMAQQGYMALNVDFEYVPPADKELYNAFLQKLVDTLRPQGYLVSSALAPKLSATQTGTLYEAHDYEAHGRILDFVILMTYEWGWSGGPPRAVAPLNEVLKVVNYALSVIPADKIVMGMPLYGYDWTLPYVSGGRWAPTVSPFAAVERAAKYGAEIEYDEESQSPFFHYYDEQGSEHVVWFEDARSVQAKFDVVKRLGLRGVSYWVLGVSFPQNWFVLGENFTIKKYVR
ncbi:LysM peptidoglycan-binding domain-containing protein [Paenibacillus sp. PAMC21692]|uniref:LysM peptidoglycan-binding domain-containing protein n=1 Tax=Paenibacillus sp. PAMC21692 TaxID=2762320 RepID=UPI00164DC930|nr:LysM peptidoglycan-binding domain-containing protein [Paenibacillus sp. PAMC21692]QNK56613.1 LysM peptidoglycan-binding domain-containing protein [Paenibacillus sp. PAMC21692]